VLATGAGAHGSVPFDALMAKRASIHGSTLRSRPLEEKCLTARALERNVLPLFATGCLRVPIVDTYPLERASDAYARFGRGGKLGKIVILM